MTARKTKAKAKAKTKPKATTHNKREPKQIESDRAHISDLYLKGWKQADIVSHLTDQNGIDYSLDMVKRDLRVIRQRWRDSSIRDFDEAKSEQLEKLDKIERELWREWERSCEDYYKHKHGKQATGPVDMEEEGPQTGDPRYMTAILNVIERRCKLLGLDQPQKIAPTDPDGKTPYSDPNQKSRDEVLNRIEELNKKLGLKK